MLSTNTTRLARENSRNRPGRDERDVVARLELALEFDLALFRPRRQEQRQRDDRDQKRRGKQQDRLQAGDQRLT